MILPKVGGTEDVIAALAGRGRIDLAPVDLPRREVKLVWHHVMGELAAGLGDTRYLSDDPAVDAAKGRCRDLFRDVLRQYAGAMGVAGLIGANYAYYAERELAAAAEELGLPFLVLHKESIRTPAQRPWFTRAYRDRIGPFAGRALAAYNADERAALVAGGVAPADRVAVTGSPRIDALHRIRTSRGCPDRGAVTVLFAIDPAAGTWTPQDDVNELGAPRWDVLARETEAVFVAAARLDPDHGYAIKVKLGRETATLERLPGGLPPNLEVVTGGTATDLLARSDVAIAFNSTVVAEAIAAGVPVLVPTFAEAAAAPEWTLPVGDAVTTVHAAEDLGPAIRAARMAGHRAELTAEQRRVLVDLVGDDEGRAGDRVWAWLRTELGLAGSG